MKILKFIDSSLNKAEAALLIVLLSLMVVVAFGQVLLRNMFHAGIVWGDILLRHLVLWIGFLGAALATSEEKHINIDALRRFLPVRVRSAVDVVTDLFASVVCYFLAKAAVDFVLDEKKANGMVFQNIPVWWVELIIPVGFALLAIHFLLRSSLRALTAMQKDAQV